MGTPSKRVFSAMSFSEEIALRNNAFLRLIEGRMITELMEEKNDRTKDSNHDLFRANLTPLTMRSLE